MEPEKIQNLAIEIRDVQNNTWSKYTDSVKELEKALGYDSERQQKEISPFTSVRDLEKLSKDTVEKKLRQFYTAISQSWLHLSKAKESDPFVLNKRIFLNATTGKPLTTAQWKQIKQDVLSAFDYIYDGEDERIVSQAMFLGKVLKGVSLQDSINLGYTDLKDQVRDAMERVQSPLWKNSWVFAQQNAGAMIVDIKQKQYTKIHDTIQTAIRDRSNSGSLQRKLFEQFGSMNRDWRRIAETEIGNSQNNGQLITELDRAKPDEQIFVQGLSSPQACPWCRGQVNNKICAVMEEAPGNGDDTIEIDGAIYTAIWPGKSNYGRNRANWWVASGTQHPHCRCTWVKYIPKPEWMAEVAQKFNAALDALPYG